YLASVPPTESQAQVYIIIGGAIAGVILLVFFMWCVAFLYKRKERADETLQPDSEEVTPRSQFSTNAYAGHINLGYSDSRDEKVDSAPVPTTSMLQPEEDMGMVSPSGSDKHLIRRREGTYHESSSSLSQHLCKRKDRGVSAESFNRGGTPSQDGSRRDEDYTSTDDDFHETSESHRPKSGVPWKNKRRAPRVPEEPFYSSPKPISLQDQINPSGMSQCDTTHSEMITSDPRFGATHQLMSNMLQGAQIFTSSEQGSLFLPPPLIPPPQEFGKTQDSSFIPGTSLPKFLPPPRPLKRTAFTGGTSVGDSRKLSQIDAYEYDPEAPPIPPRNYTREEAGLPPLQESASPSRPPMKDAQTEARVESMGSHNEEGYGLSNKLTAYGVKIKLQSNQQGRHRHAAESSEHQSDSGGSESTSVMPNVSRLRRRFHDLLDDAFSLLSGQRPGDKVTPLTTPTSSRKTRSRSAAVPQRGKAYEKYEEEEEQGLMAAGRPWSAAAAVHASTLSKEAQVFGSCKEEAQVVGILGCCKKEAQVVGILGSCKEEKALVVGILGSCKEEGAQVVGTLGFCKEEEAQVAVGVIPLEQSKSPRSAWADMGRPGTSMGRPSSVPPGASRPGSVAARVRRPSSGPSVAVRPGSSRSSRSITPVNMPPSPDQPDGRQASATHLATFSRSTNEPLDPDTGLRASDPAVPLIRAIKEELKRFKSTISTDSSNA
ncbi:hypothetical protein SK128_010495, partial [Halocaridina rubra]